MAISFFFIFILVPGTLLLFLLTAVTQKKIFLKILGGGWVVVATLGIVLFVTRPLFETIKLKKEDLYGSYIIDRSKFPGRQADWQYNTFRFTITPDDRITFYVIDGSRIVKLYVGTVYTVKPYESYRLAVSMQQPTHHIMSSNPTIYRRGRQFYLVFNSPLFGNVFFRKGDWEPLHN
ncbi:hypothetical protein [Hymenobacter metallilatus]|uniref:Uncharacterized protein n=1 Tax=Hymenobacter metallilatus TaxID=2493666 RepID=A0A428IXT2_9BACT|nr:hypothetical protein [Hymenobacter metallilatus]RSK23871.1 hypothetical protein EI290_21845 [Hymenobacter metallilatus]